MCCKSRTNLLCAEVSSSTVRDAVRFCLCLHRRQRGTTLISFDQEEYFSYIVWSMGFVTRQVDLFCSGRSTNGVGSISANVLRFTGATLVDFSKWTGAGTPWVSDLVR
jgi:hypothetical protein